MPTTHVEVVNRQVLLAVKVGVPGAPEGPHPFTALVDTGAQITMISHNVVSQIGAISTSVTQDHACQRPANPN